MCYGNPECLGARDTRYRRFQMPDKVCYLAYNRSYGLNLPAAIWTAEQ